MSDTHTGRGKAWAAASARARGAMHLIMQNPLHLQPVFQYLGYKAGDFPVTERVASEGISLPMNPYLNDRQVNQVVSAFC